MKKKKYRPKLKSTALDRRQRTGKKLLSPFSRVQNLVNWTSWTNDRLPNILWACVLAGSLDRDHYLALFREIATSARYALEDEDHASLCHNFLSTLDQDAFDRIFSPLASDDGAAPLAQCLTLIDRLPDVEHWRRLFPHTAPSTELWDTLARGVFHCIDHQSQAATDVRWLKVVFLAISGKLLLPGDPESPREDDLVEELRLYPDHGDMRKVRPTIRAIEMTLGPMEVGSEKGEAIPGFDSEATWNELFQKTDCVLGTHSAPLAEDRKALVDELTTTIDQIIDHFLASISTTGVDARMDASFGIALYALTLTFELAHSPGRIFASGRILLRTIAECLITLTYLRVGDNPTLWRQFRNYGVGQTGLAFLKTSGLDDVPDYLDMAKLEMVANEDTWLEYQDIDFGAWANKNLRAMSEEAGVKDVYDRYYDWPSGFVHGNWGSIRDAAFTTCLNPLHRFHRVPRPLQPMPSVLVDCCKLCNRTLDELNGLYPAFRTRIQWHKT